MLSPPSCWHRMLFSFSHYYSWLIFCLGPSCWDIFLLSHSPFAGWTCRGGEALSVLGCRFRWASWVLWFPFLCDVEPNLNLHTQHSGYDGWKSPCLVWGGHTEIVSARLPKNEQPACPQSPSDTKHMQFFPLHKQVLAKYPSPARALLAVMLCMSEQPHLPRQLHALPSKSQRRSFLKLNKLRWGIFATPLHLCSGQGPGHCSAPARALPSLLIFRTVIQLFVIN